MLVVSGEFLCFGALQSLRQCPVQTEVGGTYPFAAIFIMKRNKLETVIVYMAYFGYVEVRPVSRRCGAGHR